jgi:predicted RNA polymerase sigma factor
MRADDVIVALDQRFRACHGRILAALTRRFGVQRFALIENAVQDAYVRALERWPSEGTPAEPEPWLVRVAHNAMIDVLRREPPMARWTRATRCRLILRRSRPTTSCA